MASVTPLQAFKAFVGGVLATKALPFTEGLVSVQNSILKNWVCVDCIDQSIWNAEIQVIATCIGFWSVYYASNKMGDAPV